MAIPITIKSIISYIFFNSLASSCPVWIHSLFVTIQGIVSGAPLSAARIPSITGKLFFLIVEMYALILQK
ncbi:hypothetical protein, partial [Methanosarcina sp.]|uniref:hypothetical protein n=1 Tax=Methanosarcina sp. TaxID=2213 RepID=UPI003C77C499